MRQNPFSVEQKMFSVVTPVYKDAYKTFPAFFSALNEQDYQHFEVIVVFDGPNKRAEKALAEEKKRYKKLTIRDYVKPWGGAPSARNYGAKEAKGDYLTFLDPDVYLYPETFRIWSNALEEHPEKDVVWGIYDFMKDGQQVDFPWYIPKDNSGTPLYYAFRFTNYCSGAFPVRKEAFVGWDETVKSLQDWDMWMRMLLKDDFKGTKFHYIDRRFFITDLPRTGGISHDSTQNWVERTKYVREKNGIPSSDICVTSIGAPFHAVNVARTLGIDYKPDPMAKPHEYKMIYLLGFYTAEDPRNPMTTQSHMNIFREFKGKKVVHFIGTDILQLHWNCSFQKIKALKKWFKDQKVKLLTEADYTQEEMAELGIKTEVVPIPPEKLYSPLPLPEKFTVAIYENQTQQMYGEELMQEVARSMPDIQFKFFGDESKKGTKHGNVEHLGWANLDDLLPQVSCNVRITAHDGLPLTPLQFMTAGRTVVSNTKLHGAIYAGKDRKEVIEAIRQAQKNPLSKEVGEYWVKELDKDKFSKTIRGYL